MGFDALETVVVVAVVVVAVLLVVLVVLVVLVLLAVLAVLVLVLESRVCLSRLGRGGRGEVPEWCWDGLLCFRRCWKASSCLSRKTKRAIQADPATSHCVLTFDGLQCLRGLSRLRNPLRLL